MIERTGEAFELDERLTVLGAKLQPGDLAPDFELDHEDPATKTMGTVRLSDSAGSLRVLSVVPSLDTSVCSIQGRKWDKLQSDLPTGAVLYTISMDLPHAQSRWQATENVEHQALSAHKNEAFAIEYGLLLREWRLLQRAIFVIDGDSVVRYVEYVADQGAEPDYDRAIAAIAETAARG
ncbi:MAG: thiol peroxidase [Thermomicrobiales bacterium]|nr:thiol peroxidase [Thermomicrobiales bacterium]